MILEAVEQCFPIFVLYSQIFWKNEGLKKGKYAHISFVCVCVCVCVCVWVSDFSNSWAAYAAKKILHISCCLLSLYTQ